MLGKLLKYDLRSCFKRFLPLWAAIFALACICAVTFRVDVMVSSLGRFLLRVLPPILLGGVFIGTAVLVIVYICDQFYHGLLGESGYLMFTLPVSTAQLVFSKLLTALILEVISVAAACISAFALVTLLDVRSMAAVFRELPDMLRVLREYPIPGGVYAVLAECILLLLVLLAVFDLKIFASISLGHLARKKRVFVSLLTYVGFSVLLSLLLSALFKSDWLWHFGGIGFAFTDSGFTLTGLGGAAAAIGTVIAGAALLGAVYFFLSGFILKYRLNLE